MHSAQCTAHNEKTGNHLFGTRHLAHSARHLALGTWHLALGTACIAAAMSSCSMVNEDLDPCAPAPNLYTTVNFIYDYNMQYTDLFTDHVGSVYLYIFDKDGIFLQRHTSHRADMSNIIDFSMRFDETELMPGNTYQLVAVAQGNRTGYASSLETPGFQVVNPMVPGLSRIEDYILRLDRKHPDGTSGVGEFEYKDVYGNTQTMIDTIWSTKPDEVQVVRIPSINYTPSVERQPDINVDVTIPMMRITNAITVNLVSGSFNGSTDPEAYRTLIHFPQGNGTIDFTGTVLPYEELYYRSLRKELITYLPGNLRDPDHVEEDADVSTGNNPGTWNPAIGTPNTRAEAQYAVQAIFGVSRLMMDDDSSLQIYDNATGQLICEIPDFSKFLASAFDYYGDDGQEFLDREYNFEISIGLGELPPGPDDPGKPDDPSGPDDPGIDDPENNWVWIDVYIEVLDWYVRINNIKF